MSNEKIFNARVQRYAGPGFPDNLTELHNRIYRERRFSLTKQFFLKILEKSDLKYSVARIDGSLEYEWLWGIYVHIGDGRQILLALPWVLEEEGYGSCSERLSAVYTKGAVHIDEIEKTISKLNDLFKNVL